MYYLTTLLIATFIERLCWMSDWVWSIGGLIAKQENRRTRQMLVFHHKSHINWPETLVNNGDL